MSRTSGGCAVLVPVKGFREAKSRLGAVLPPQGRADLARAMAERVVRAAGALPVTVLTADAEVGAWARARGCRVVADAHPAFNRAIETAVAGLRDAGVGRAVVVHGDLPLVEDVTWLAATSGVVIVPDRRDDGTNAIALPTAAPFRFRYGPGSRARHEAEAVRLGLGVTVVHDAAIGWDVDLPEDLAWPGSGTSTPALSSGSRR